MRPIQNNSRKKRFTNEGIILALNGTAVGITATWKVGNDRERQNSDDSS